MAIETLLIGRTLGGRYRIERLIGKGGMGAVFAATDDRLHRRVAVKVILEAAGPGREQEMRARFIREATVVAGLHDVHVVAVHDFGTDTELDLDFLVMEFLEGETLDEHLACNGTPAPERAVEILLGAARGLAAGHRAKLVHRDVKPANLFFSFNAQGELHVRVLDFGIVDVAQQQSAATQLTQFGSSPCTPYFASPEQLRGERLTAASDVYSLGVVAFQILAGYGPFDEARTGDSGHAAPPMRPMPAGVSRELRILLARALSFDPTQRFPDAGAFATALESIAAARSVSPPERRAGTATFSPPAPVAPGRERRTKVPWLAGVVVAALVLGGVVRELVTRSVDSVGVDSFAPLSQPAVPDPGDHDDTGRVGPEISPIKRDFNYIESNLASFARSQKKVAGLAADSAFAVVYEDETGVRKIRVRLSAGSDRKTMEFYYTTEQLIFAYVVTPQAAYGTVPDEERFYFQQGRMIRWLDGRRHAVPPDDSAFRRNEALLLCEGARLLQDARGPAPTIEGDWRSCLS